jgi:hypothetical protein
MCGINLMPEWTCRNMSRRGGLPFPFAPFDDTLRQDYLATISSEDLSTLPVRRFLFLPRSLREQADGGAVITPE